VISTKNAVLEIRGREVQHFKEVTHAAGVRSSSPPMATYLAITEPQSFEGLIVDLILK
jgi:hypothetical protein